MKRAKVASSTYSAGSTSSTTWKYDLQPCPKKMHVRTEPT
jgi:hypothetical protein